MLNLTNAEYQKLVLMLGSKKALGTYLGLSPKETNTLWVSEKLVTPLNWLRNQPRLRQLEMLAETGSLKALAKKLGCSDTALRPIYLGETVKSLDWTEEFLLAQLARYKSVRLVAYINDVSESLIRKLAEDLNVELSTLIDYSFGGNSNSKGRRAELDYAAHRGDLIIEDKNITDGSQAKYDFDDSLLGRVNVKSSCQYSYRAKTRKDNPDYWKFSTSGWATTDYFVCLCYDLKMNTLVGYCVLEASSVKSHNTVTISRSDIEEIHGLSTCDKPK